LNAARKLPREAGILLVMNDIAPDREDEFNRWYQEQHVPERLGLPGFRTARRYRAVGAGPAYMAMYECDSIAVLASDAYRQRLLHPTQWTRSVMPAFANMLRASCRQTWSEGAGIGGGAFVLLCKPVAASADGARDYIKAELHPRLRAEAFMMRMALWESDAQAAGGPSPEAALRGGADADADWVLFLETHSPERAAPALQRAMSGSALAQAGLQVNSVTRYQLIYAWGG